MKQSFKHPYRIAITGGIGSGKSYVCRLIASHYGFPVYQCDDAAKQLMVSDEPLRRQLMALLGSQTYLPDGSLNRAYVSQQLFQHADMGKKIEQMVHPCVRRDFRKWVLKQTAPCVVMECAILYEAGFDTEVDEVIAVDAPVEVRLHRAMERDGATEEAVLSRMKRQFTPQQLLSKGTFVLWNDGEHDLLSALEHIFKPFMTHPLA